MKEKDVAFQDVGNIIEGGLQKYANALEMILVGKLEEYYGGPKEWPNSISPTSEEDEEALIEVWNAAIEQAINIVKGVA